MLKIYPYCGLKKPQVVSIQVGLANKWPFFLNLLCLVIYSFAANSQVSGTVFKDFNANGTYQTSGTHIEIGMPGVIVNATKPDGAALTVAYTGGGSSTNSTGAYTVTGGTAGQIRLEFVMPDTYTFASKGAIGNTTVIFPTSAQTTVNLAVNYPADYCQSAPSMVIPCYVANRPPTGAADTDVLVKFAYSASGTTHGADHVPLADAGEIGSTWGIAYNRESQLIYAASLIKRHVGMKDNNSDGKDDIGAIYSITPSGTATFWLDLASLGVDVGLSQMPTIAARALPNTLLGPSRDSDIFPLIGKLGLGDIDISDDNKQLFVVNLFDKKVYTIDIATKTLVGSGIAIPDACSGGTARPFALTYHKGKLYAGAICDALTSQATSDLKASVYRLDGSTFTNILSFPLNYLKGPAFWDRDHGSVKYGTQWNPWRDVMLPMIGLNYPDPNTGQPQNNPVYPQPILADIEFDVDEAMILTFNDRLGHQTGTLNYSTDPSDTKLYSSVVGGDILRAALVNGSYVLESNGTSGGVTTTGAGNGEGPGTLNGTNTGYTSPAGEFYVGDNSLGYYHGENVQGGSALFPGRREVAVPVTDPINAFSGGVFWLSNTAGTTNKSYEIFPYSYDNTLFGKSNGLGDLELMCDNPPIEIGNRVWEDTDNDGIQDAGEAGIANLTVTLCDKNGVAIPGAVATTDANGNYFFSSASGTGTPSAIYNISLAFNTQYILKFPTTSGTKTLTVSNTGSNDQLDSDAASDGKVAFSTGYAGQNNHSFDVGYGTCSVVKPVVEDASRCGTGTLTATITTNCTGGSTLKIFSDVGLTVDVTSSFTIGATTLTNPSISTTTTYYALCQLDASCKSISDAFVLTVDAKPNAAASQATVCAGTSVTLTGTSPTTGTWTAQGNNPSGGTLGATTSGVATVSFATTTSGDFNFIYTVSGCSDTVKISVNAKPVIADGSATLCAGESVDLTSKITNYGTYLSPVWTVGTVGGTAVTTPSSVKPASTTTYVLVAQNAAGCKDTANVVVTVNAKPNAGQDILGTSAVCTSVGTVTLSASPSGGAWNQLGATPSVANVTNAGAVSGMTSIGIYQFVYTLNGCIDTVSVETKNCAKGSLGDYVWKDENNDGLQQDVEVGVNGVKMILWSVVNGVATTKLDSVVTFNNGVKNGYYSFANLSQGDYKVQMDLRTIPTECAVSSKQDAGIDTNDNDFTEMGWSPTVTIDPTSSGIAKDNPTIDAGLIIACTMSKITMSNSPICSSDLQTYTMTFSVQNQLGVVKVNKGVLSGNNPYTVSGIPSGALVTITDSLNSVCKMDTVIIGLNCNCNPPLPTIAIQSLTACIGDTFPTLKATVVGLATVEWYSQPTGGVLMHTGLDFKPVGTMVNSIFFYAQARSTDPSCPTAISSSRVSATINAQSCIDTVDVALKKLISKKVARIGDVLTYTIKVYNQASKNATGVSVKDSMASTVEFVVGSIVTSRGTASFVNNTISWNIGSLAANGDTVILTYQVKAVQMGIHLNVAEVCTTNEKDVDSTPCNHSDSEDDIDRQCFTVPISLCTGSKIEARVSDTYVNVKWFKDGGIVPVATGNVVLLSEIGTYTFTADGQTCPTEGCCPIIIEASSNCCPPAVCVPVTTRKIKG